MVVVPPGVYLLCHGLMHGYTLWAWPYVQQLMLQGVPSPEWNYHCATIPSEVYLLWHRHNHSHRCFEMYLLWCGLTHIYRHFGVSCSQCGLIHRSQSLRLKFTLKFQPVQYSSNALAICQPRCMAIAVIIMFPGTAESDDKHYSKQQKQKKATSEY